jgi:WD40 repeat protein
MVQEVAFSPKGETLATSWRLEAPANEKNPEISQVLLWDVATWKSRTVPRANFLAFTPDGRVVFTTDGHDVRLWDSATERKWAVLRDSKSYNGISALSLDGKKLAKAFDLQNGQPRDPYFGSANLGGKDCPIGLWDLTKLWEKKRD